MPRNSANGFLTAFFAVVTGFAMIWHIWWLAILGLAGATVILVVFGWRERIPVEVSAEHLAADELSRHQTVSV
jgi:cytochrome o ubiquinol oxidase subunit 1